MKVELQPVIIGVPIGDPNGIGPEVAVRAAALCEDPFCLPLLLGDARFVRRAAALMPKPVPVQVLKSPERVERKSGVLQVMDLPVEDGPGFAPGAVTAESGQAALAWLRASVELAMDGSIDGLACAPANKEAMRMAGSPHSGQTEYIAALTGGEPGTVLVSEPFRVFQTTTHVSLREACDLITQERVLSQIRTARRILTFDFGIENPLIAVCGLNPHSGDGGLLGQEELAHIIPAIEQARSEGIRVDGPLPGDTAFARVKRQGHDGVVAMYHDQANTILKFLSADPVTVTVGLPVVRTTVGHGTAGDIAWKGIADPGCMSASIAIAAQLARARRKG